MVIPQGQCSEAVTFELGPKGEKEQLKEQPKEVLRREDLVLTSW